MEPPPSIFNNARDVAKHAAAHGYVVIGLREWVEFLDAHRVENDIFADYRSYVSRLLRDREAALAALEGAGGHAKLGIDYVQYEFVKRLRDACVDTIGGSALHHGCNLGGTPWAHWRFAHFPNVYQAHDEVLFHRVDARMDETKGARGFCLTTRQYARVKGDPGAQAVKLARLRAHRAAFTEAAKESSLRFARPATDRHGANESEIGIVFFDDAENSVTRVLRLFPLLHAAFLAALTVRDR